MLRRIRSVLTILIMAVMIATSFGVVAAPEVNAASGLPKVSSLSSSACEDSVTLSWAKLGKKQQKKVKGIAIFRDGNLIGKVGKKSISFTDTGLRAGKDYSYSVKTYKATKKKEWFNKKTNKWQKKKPAKKWRGKSRKVNKYSRAAIINVSTAAAPLTSPKPEPKPEPESELTYTITWKNWDESVLGTETVKAGEMPSFSGDTPKRPSGSGFVYEFEGWSPALTAANTDATYIARFKAYRVFTITWKNWDDTVLRTDRVREGTKPVYPGTPIRPADEIYAYRFTGWSPAVTATDRDTVYTAQYEAVDINSEFTVTWKNWDGTELGTDTVKAGVVPAYTGDAPARDPDDTYKYTFDGWSPDVIPVTGNAEYKAKYKRERLKKYAITWRDYSTGNILEIDEVTEGKIPTYDGPTPTKPAIATESVTWTYTFAGWFPYIKEATENTTYYTYFHSTANDISVAPSEYSYDVRFLQKPYGNSKTWNLNGKDLADGDGKTVLYFETNNPEKYGYSLEVLDPNGRLCDFGAATASQSKYSDLDTSKIKGSVWVCAPACTGNCTIVIFEYDDAGTRKIVKTVPVKLRDWNTEEKEWRKSVIDEVTEPSMSNADKMLAICRYILANNDYYRVPAGSQPNDGSGGYIFFISEEGLPYWVAKRQNSFTSPSLLVRFGKDLGYPLHNCYYDYPELSWEWERFHMYAYSEEDNLYFAACPGFTTGYTDLTDIKMFDPETFDFWEEPQSE